MITALGGTLVRKSDGWYWRDGQRATDVEDLTAGQFYNFRISRGKFVEVPISIAQRDGELEWVWNGYRDQKYREDLSGDHRGERVFQIDNWYGEGDIPGISAPEVSVRGVGFVRADGSRRAIARVALVPIEEWDACFAEKPLGITWDRDNEPSIFAKAHSLGYSGNP